MRCTRRSLAVLAALVAAAIPGAGCTAGSTQTAVPPQSVPRGEWSKLPDGPLSARREAAGAWVRDRFVLVGGWDDRPCPPGAGCLPPAEPALRDGASYHPATGRWSGIARAPMPVTSVTGPAVIGDTMYLLTGNPDRDDSPVAMLAYSSTKNAWTRLPAPSTQQYTLVTVGRRLLAVFYTAERKPAVDYLFDFSRRAWRRLPSDPIGRSWGRSAVPWQGRLLLTASDPDLHSESRRTHVATFDVERHTWRRLPGITIAGGNAVSVHGRVVWAFTSFDGVRTGRGEFYPNGAVLEPDRGTRRLLPSPPRGKGLVGYLSPVGDRAMVGGHLVDPVTEQWTKLKAPPWPVQTSRNIVTNDHSILAWGGSDDVKNLDDGWILNV